ncbi:DUF3231 family protein [Bacillus sp. 31A1R]|uniref:DUF3231 family protein n=1 Tax=Robertmurraya mangrovi TaxID=3098077 RepID=A0ABU5IWI9_9BACI|nr:DUF3231 family protein [Bacillus sp. 31A1R]MDZ5471481.1 DUF3231 family protein [Bacillus sp. 31A1R]
MTDITHDVSLTSAEIANLWTQYINDSMAICTLNYYLKDVEDKDIKEILTFALNLSKSHLEKIKLFLKKENYPVPMGFNENDVNLNAPRLFSDTFMLVYMHIMTIHGMTGYAGALSTSIRKDQVEYFVKCNSETMELYQKVIECLTLKGIVSRPSTIYPPERPSIIEKQSFLTGWFGNKRPLNAIEASGVFFNIKKDLAKIVLEIAFSQVAISKEVRDFIKRGEKICDEHFRVFNDLLEESNLATPKRYDAEVTNSTVSPFSEKLMVYHIVSLISSAIGYYGAAFALSQRRDLAAKYALLIADIAKYAEDGANLMIDKKWMEQPPTFPDREELAKNK